MRHAEAVLMGARDERFAGYRRAHLWARGVDGVDLTVRPDDAGALTGRFPFHDRVAHVLTAFEPAGRQLSVEENERRQRALLSELPDQARRRWDAVAGAADGTHTETSVLVVGLTDDEAIALGDRWGQDAIFRWTTTAWSIVPCDGAPTIDQGWVLRRALTACGHDGRCTLYFDGHRTHPIRARRTGETPWGWRDGVVTASAPGIAKVDYVDEPGAVTVSHHADLSVTVGDPVRVHEEFRMLGTPDGWRAVLVDGGRGPVPTPAEPTLWSVETSPGIVDLSSGDAIATDRPD